MERVHDFGTAQPVVVGAKCIHQDVAHHVDLGEFGTLLVGYAVAAHACGEEQVGETVDDEAVYFLGHLQVEGTCACHEMRQADAALLGDDGSRHGRREVVDDDDHIRGMTLEIFLEGCHHLAHQFVETVAVHAEEHVGTRNLQVAEEGRFEGGVGFCAGIHQTVVHFPALLPHALHGMDDGGHLDEVGACAHYDANVLHNRFVLIIF